MCPRDGIAHPDAGRLWASPEFQVLWPVVVTYAVTMMDGFRWQEVAAEDLLHNDYVFEYVLALSRTWALRQLAQVADLPCFGSPHGQTFLERHAGQRRCLLEG